MIALGFMAIFMLGTFSTIQSQMVEAQEEQQQNPVSILSGAEGSNIGYMMNR